MVDVGDDHIACVSYKRPLAANDTLVAGVGWTGSQQINRNGVIANNVVKGGNINFACRGISVLGGQDIVVANNVIEGHESPRSNGAAVMTSGIIIQGGTSPFRFWKPRRIKVIGNTIRAFPNHATTFLNQFQAEVGGIRIFGADSVDVLANTIQWHDSAYGMIVRATNELTQYGFNNSVNDLRIEGNNINNSRAAIRILTTSAGGATTGWHKRIYIRNNNFSNSALQAINADSVLGIAIENNFFWNINRLGRSNVDAVRVNKFGGSLTITNNRFYSDSTVARAINVSNPVTSDDSIAYGREYENTFDLTASTALVTMPMFGTTAKFHSQQEKRQHYATAAPTTGMWAVGDIVWRTNVSLADSVGGPAGWICVAPDSSGAKKWFEFGQIRRSTDLQYGSIIYTADTVTATGVMASSANNTVFDVGFGVNGNDPDNPKTARQTFVTAGQVATFAFSGYYTLTRVAGKGIWVRLMVKRVSGTGNLYVTRCWLTLKKLD